MRTTFICVHLKRLNWILLGFYCQQLGVINWEIGFILLEFYLDFFFRYYLNGNKFAAGYVQRIRTMYTVLLRFSIISSWFKFPKWKIVTQNKFIVVHGTPRNKKKTKKILYLRNEMTQNCLHYHDEHADCIVHIYSIALFFFSCLNMNNTCNCMMMCVVVYKLTLLYVATTCNV